MAIPPAYFLSWTCYGQRLHGDQRGSVDRHHNIFGTPVLAPHAPRELAEYQALKTDAVFLTRQIRAVVCDAILEHLPFRKGDLHALNVRPTHVHLVLTAPTPDPGALAGSFKAWATRKLRDAGLIAKQARTWTAMGSNRYLWDVSSIKGAVGYVLFEQGDADEFVVAGESWREFCESRSTDGTAPRFHGRVAS